MGVSHALTPRLHGFAWATLVANIGIVVTGGAVRLTGSGLGCPTWPRCTDKSFTPHGAMDVHQAIEFGNRMLTFVLAAVAILTFVAAWNTAHRWLTLGLALGIPAQAVIGGITVLTDLNPWVVAFHLLCSMAMIGLATLLVWRTRPSSTADGLTPPGPGQATLAWLVFATTWLVLYVGTVVTGSGPHAGDAESPRNGIDPLQVSQIHADLVFLLLGLTLGLVVVGRGAVRRAALTLLVVELAQGLIGFVQYFTDLPVVLVGFHMLGAAIISACATWVVLTVRHTQAHERLLDPLAATVHRT